MKRTWSKYYMGCSGGSSDELDDPDFVAGFLSSPIDETEDDEQTNVG